MNPENVVNLGQNWSLVIIVGVLWVAGIIFLRIVLRSLDLWKEAADEEDEGKQRKAFRKLVLQTVFMGALFVTGFVLIFIGHGSQPVPQITEPAEDGFYKQVQDMPEATPEKKAKKNPVSTVLDQVRKHASEPDGGEDDYIKKAVERSQRILNN